MRNTGPARLRFRLAGAPGEPVERFDVAPDGVVEVPASYATSAILRRIAPGLVMEPEPGPSFRRPSDTAAAVAALKAPGGAPGAPGAPVTADVARPAVSASPRPEPAQIAFHGVSAPPAPPAPPRPTSADVIQRARRRGKARR